MPHHPVSAPLSAQFSKLMVRFFHRCSSDFLYLGLPPLRHLAAQLCLSAFTSHRAPLPIQRMVSCVFFFFSFFFLFWQCHVLRAPFQCPHLKCGPCMPPPLAAQKLRLLCSHVLMNAAACIFCRVSPFVLFFLSRKANFPPFLCVRPSPHASDLPGSLWIPISYTILPPSPSSSTKSK